MKTESKRDRLEFTALGRREVLADFEGSHVTSDIGVLLLREADLRTDLMAQFAQCSTDHRDQGLIEHSVVDLLRQRVYGIELGYEDLNDHDLLRIDRLIAAPVGKTDPTGQSRAREADRPSLSGRRDRSKH